MSSKHSKRAPSSEATAALKFLRERGIPVREATYRHDDDVTDYGAEAAAALGVHPDRVFKTLLVSPPEGGGFGVVVLPVSHRVAMKSAAAALGWKKAVLTDPAVAERRTGYVVGGISPFGQKTPSPTVLDTTALEHETIFVSGGRRGLDIEIAATGLLDALGATTADLCA